MEREWKEMKWTLLSTRKRIKSDEIDIVLFEIHENDECSFLSPSNTGREIVRFSSVEASTMFD
jgi:hypothetical protein